MVLYRFFVLSMILILPAATALSEETQNLTEDQLWTDGIYYLKVGQLKYAEAYLKAYIDKKPDPVKALELSEKDPRSIQILIQLQEHPKLGSISKKLLEIVNEGWQIRRKDTERIKKEIERLKNSPRARFYASQRLKESGEYAVPVILEYLNNPNEVSLHPILVDVLKEIDRPAVEPLLAALPSLKEQPKLLVIEALAKLGYPQAIPYLKEIIEDKSTPNRIRQKAAEALEVIFTVNPRYRSDDPAYISYYKFAKLYYEHSSIIKPASNIRLAGSAPDIREEMPNIWVMDGEKLTYIPIDWKIYYQTMTMRLAKKGLELSQTTRDKTEGKLIKEITALYLIADCERELIVNKEAINDPIHTESFPSASYFIAASGTESSLIALKETLTRDNTDVAAYILKVLATIASDNILKTIGSSQPIIDALGSDDKGLRIYSTIALAWAAPSERFPSDTYLVDTLNEIIEGKITIEDDPQLVYKAIIGLKNLTQKDCERFKINKENTIEALKKVLKGSDWKTSYLAAQILSMLPSAKAQISLAEFLLESEGDNALAILDLLKSSIKENGNLLNREIKQKISEAMINQKNTDLANAFAELLGMLDTPEDAIEAIIKIDPLD